MQKRHLKKAVSGLMFGAGAVALATSQASAITPYGGPLEGFEADTDAYTPPGAGAYLFNAINDPGLAGLPPGVGPGDGGGAPEFIPGQDWFDLRQGGATYGLIEEVPVPYGGVPSPDGSAHIGLVQYKAGAGAYGSDGVFGRAGRQTANPGLYSAQTDVYNHAWRNIAGVQSDWPAGGGYPSFGWTNAVRHNITGAYYTESGMRLNRNLDGTWDIDTTGGADVATSMPADAWFTWEVKPVMSATMVLSGVDATMQNIIAFEHNVWSIDNTILYGTFTVDEYTGSAEFRFLGGPRYNWWAYGNAAGGDVALLVDNNGWADPITLAEIPEPASLALAGLGSLLLLRRKTKA